MEEMDTKALPQRPRRRRGRKMREVGSETAKTSESPLRHQGFGLEDSKKDAAGTSIDWRDSGSTVTGSKSTGFPLQYEFLDHSADTYLHAFDSTFRGMLEQSCLGVFGLMTDPSTVAVPPDLPSETARADTTSAKPITMSSTPASEEDVEACAKRGVLRVRSEASDVLLLLFKLLDECLYAYSGLGLIAREARVVAMGHPPGALEAFTAPVVAGTEAAASSVAAAGGGGFREADAESDARMAVVDASGRSAAGGVFLKGESGAWWVEVELRGEQLDLSRHPQGTEVKAITFAQMTIVPPEALSLSKEALSPTEGGSARGSFAGRPTSIGVGGAEVPERGIEDAGASAAGADRHGNISQWHSFVVLDI